MSQTKNSELKYNAPKPRRPRAKQRAAIMADKRTKRNRTRAARDTAARGGW